jgi:hypothetical protein
MCLSRVFATFTTLLGTLLSAIAVGIPYWATAASISLKSFVHEAHIYTGLWGFCTRLLLRIDPDIPSTTMVADACFPFHTPSDGLFLYLNSSEILRLPIDPFCAIDRSSDAFLSFSRLLALSSFSDFVRISCSSLGNTSLVFGCLTPIFGAIAVIFLFFVLCCPLQSRGLQATALVFLFLALFSSIITFSVFTNMRLLVNTMHAFGFAFALEIVAAILFLAAFGCAWEGCHGKQQDQPTHASEAPVYDVVSSPPSAAPTAPKRDAV